MIQNEAGDRREDLLKFTTALAGLHLNGSMIGQLAQIVEEAGMVVDATFAEAVRGTIFGQALLLDAEQQAHKRAAAALLGDLLYERFGADPRSEALADRLADWPSGAVHAVTAAKSLDELENAQPST